jgi:endonuclease/exonuclease/phosphatase family metal-dependent hydrolase
VVVTVGVATVGAEETLGFPPVVEVLSETSVPGDLEVDRTLVGGLSGLAYDPACDLYYAVSDDRGSIDFPRIYTLKIQLVGETVEAQFLGATLLRDFDGAPFERGDLDPEAIALSDDGTLYLAAEGVPHRGIPPMVARFGLDGSIREVIDLPDHYLPAGEGARGVRDNHGFEGLSLTPDGRTLFVATESALLQDGPAADLERGSLARLLEIDVASGRVKGEYLYAVDPVPDVPIPSTAYASIGVSEILALGNRGLLVVERSFSAGVGNRVRLYHVSLRGEHGITGVESIRDLGRPQPQPVRKSLVADLEDLGVDPDNIEGMALGASLLGGRKRMLVLISDNNFQPSVQSNQIVVLAASNVLGPVPHAPDATIHDIQGADHVSPFVGRCVSSVEGVVTVVLGSRGGQAFWMQDPLGDGDPKTSEGLFVTTPDGLPLVETGDRIRLWGRVEERSWGLELPVTRLFASDLRLEARRQAMPRPVVIGQDGLEIPQPEVASVRLETFDPDLFAADAFESLEGMLVRVEEPVVVGPTSKYGEVVVLADGGRKAEQRTERGGLKLLGENSNPQRIIIDDRLVADPPPLRTGDRLTGAVDGILHYSFGSYKLFNLGPLPEARSAGLAAGRTTLRGDAAHMTVASFNLENLSAVSDDEEFAKLAAIIADNLGEPDIVAVQEVQDDTGPDDDGTVSAARTLSRLVEAIEAAGGPRYVSRSIDPVDGADGGQAGGNIRNAFLFNPSRVRFIDRPDCGDDSESAVSDGPSLTCSPGLVDPGHRAFQPREEGRSGSRKPLVGEFRFAGESIFLVNLHLRSKGGDDPIFGRRQPRLEGSRARRTEEAEVVATFVKELLDRHPSARVVVLGDLNDFENTEPLEVLGAAGLEDLVKRVPNEDRYSFVYRGNSQVLDHILVSESLSEGAEVEMVHVNAEYPASDRASDHDPVIVRLSIGR